MEEQSIRLQGRFERPEDFAGWSSPRATANSITLGQVADVTAVQRKPTSAARFNGNGDRDGHRQVAGIRDRVRERRREKRSPNSPRRYQQASRWRSVRDAGVRVRNSVANVEETLIEGAALTVLVVFLFLNSWRSTVITGLRAAGLGDRGVHRRCWPFGFTLNIMSLLGLSLAIGILIDDAIVVRENIVRHMELGRRSHAAAHKGTDEIGLAVTATTFSIVAVFVPVGFMPGVAGQFFKPFALTIAAAVLVSLFVSFSLDPMLSAYWPDPQSRRTSVATRSLERWTFNRGSTGRRIGIQVAIGGRSITVCSCSASRLRPSSARSPFKSSSAASASRRSAIIVSSIRGGDSAVVQDSSIRRFKRKPSRRWRGVTARSRIRTPPREVRLALAAVDNATVYVHLVPKSNAVSGRTHSASRLRAELAVLRAPARTSSRPGAERKPEGVAATAWGRTTRSPSWPRPSLIP